MTHQQRTCPTMTRRALLYLATGPCRRTRRVPGPIVPGTRPRPSDAAAAAVARLAESDLPAAETPPGARRDRRRACASGASRTSSGPRRPWRGSPTRSSTSPRGSRCAAWRRCAQHFPGLTDDADRRPAGPQRGPHERRHRRRRRRRVRDPMGRTADAADRAGPARGRDGRRGRGRDQADRRASGAVRPAGARRPQRSGRSACCRPGPAGAE